MTSLTLSRPPKARKPRAKKIALAAQTAEQIEQEHGENQVLVLQHMMAAALAEAQQQQRPYCLLAPDAGEPVPELVEDSDDVHMARLLAGFLAEGADCMRIWGDGAVEDFLDTFIHGIHRRLERYERAQDAIGQQLVAIERAWDGTEIPRNQRQEAEERRDRLAQMCERYGLMLDAAAATYREITGGTWMAPATLRKPPPAAVLGAAANAVLSGKLVPASDGDYRVFVTGGECDNGAVSIEAVNGLLDKLWTKHKRLRIATGSNKQGVEAAVRLWAAARKVPVEVFAPTWALGSKAGFDRNRRVFAEFRPQAVIVIGGGGVQANAAEIARAADLPCHIAYPTDQALARQRQQPAPVVGAA